MESYFKTLLVLHILAGSGSLITGVLALAVQKGGKAHRSAGKIFFYAMLVVALTGAGIALPKNMIFLLMIAVFSSFLSYFGYRATLKQSRKVTVIDWLMLGLAIVNNFFMLYSLQVVLVAFGLLSVRLIVSQFRLCVKMRRGEVLPPAVWLRHHIGMMMGAFIGTVTAFVVVNVQVAQFKWLPWLLPTIILMPLLIYYQRQYAPGLEKRRGMH